jgi:hypothetical protein
MKFKEGHYYKELSYNRWILKVVKIRRHPILSGANINFKIVNCSYWKTSYTSFVGDANVGYKHIPYIKGLLLDNSKEE